METTCLLIRSVLHQYVKTHALEPSTEKNYTYAVNAFEEWFNGSATVANVGDNLSEWIRYRSSTYAPHGVRSQRGALITLLRFAAELYDYGMPRKIRSVRIAAVQPTWFSDAELLKLLTHADGFQKAAIHVVRCSGPRRGDVFSVRWSQVSGDILRFVMNKPGERHTVRLSVDALDACRAIRNQKDDRLIPIPFKFGAWHDRWHALGKRAGIDTKRRGLQAIRRVASSLVAKEQGEYAAAKMLGHSNSSGIVVFRTFYSVGDIVDQPAPSPPPLAKDAGS